MTEKNKKIAFELSEEVTYTVRRLVANYKKIHETIMELNLINSGGIWLLSIQEEGIHKDVEYMEKKLVSYKKIILQELKNIGGNIFAAEVLDQ